MLHRILTLTLLILALPTTLLATGIPITGQVLDSNGKPRAKTEVHLEPILPTYERAVLRLEGRPGTEPVARTQTRADGTFDLEAPDVGMWKVVVTAPGALTTEFRLLPLFEAAELPAIRLAKSAKLEVRLKGTDGKPRPGTVGAMTVGIRGGAWRPQIRLASAGEDGIAHLPLGKDEKIQLEVLAEGHPLAIFELWDESQVTIDLKAGLAGKVRITDQQKRPLPQAIAFQGSALLPLGLSDEEGYLPLVLQKEKAPSVRVSTADRWNGSFELDFGTPERRKIQDLRLDPPHTIDGRVIDLSNRDPIPGALIWAVRGEFAIADEKGRFSLEDGVYKSRTLRAAATGYQPGYAALGEGTPSIGLTPAAVLAGKVVDGDDNLLAGVAIGITLAPQSGTFVPSQRRMLEGWQGRTSKRGQFRVPGLPTGVGYRLTFKHRGFAPQTVEVEPLEPFENRSNLRVMLEPGRVAFGQVVDEDDLPIARAEITFTEPPPTNDPMAMMRAMRGRQAAVDEPSYLTDAQGRFEITDLAVGRYDLEVRARGFAPAKIPGVRLSEQEHRADFGTIVLVPGASVEGRVTDPDGNAIADVEIGFEVAGNQRFRVTGPGDKPEQIRTDAAGRFTIVDLIPDLGITLTVTKKGFAAQSLAAIRPPTEEPLTIVLQPAARLWGKVLDEQGEPVRGAHVMAQPDRRAMRSPGRASMRPAWANSNPDGSYLLEDVNPGVLQVTADADGYQQKSQTGIEIAAGAELELDFVLDAGAVVEGTVTTADGEAVVQAMIQVSEPVEPFNFGNVISAGGRTDIEGNYRVTGAPTGAATITVYSNHGQQLEKSIEVRPGTNVVDLVLEPGYDVSGQVVTPDGTPMAGAQLSLQPLAQQVMHFSFGGTSQATSGGDGLFKLSGVKAGQYRVTASREGYAPALSESFEVKGDVSGLLLELGRGVALKGQVLGLSFDELGSLSLIAYSHQGTMRQGQVDFEAAYAFENLSPGLWQVQAEVAGSGRTTSLQVQIPEGTSDVERDIEFGTGLTLTGLVLDGGEPLVGANISVSGSGNSGFGTTGDDGRFRIENLAAGNYQVMVMGGTGVQHLEALELTNDHDLRIEIATGAISGFVRDNTGEPLAGVAVVLEAIEVGDSSWARRFSFGNRGETDSRGYFHIPVVRQGSWRLLASRAGYSPGETTVNISGGATSEVEVRLTPTEGISFEVVLESGVPVSLVQVALLDASSRRITTGAHPVVEGKVRVETVPPGRWDLVVQGGDSANTRFTVTAPGDQGRLVLPIGGALQIHVPELESVPLANLQLTGPDGRPFVSLMGIAFAPGQWILNNGKTLIPSLTPGTWSFIVEHNGQTWSGNATVTSGGNTEVNLQ